MVIFTISSCKTYKLGGLKSIQPCGTADVSVVSDGSYISTGQLKRHLGDMFSLKAGNNDFVIGGLSATV